jgi:hypothetical protein
VRLLNAYVFYDLVLEQPVDGGLPRQYVFDVLWSEIRVRREHFGFAAVFANGLLSVVVHYYERIKNAAEVRV